MTPLARESSGMLVAGGEESSLVWTVHSCRHGPEASYLLCFVFLVPSSQALILALVAGVGVCLAGCERTTEVASWACFIESSFHIGMAWFQ